jgi:hypothetical protein
MAGLAMVPIARSGHEQSVYPSYYPHEIEIATLKPAEAAERLSTGKLHAYVGGAAVAMPRASEPNVGVVRSLGSYLVIRLNPTAVVAQQQASACAAMAALMRAIAAAGSELTLSAYPVTPLHGDYLRHADRAEAARQRWLTLAPLSQRLAVRADTDAARRFLPTDWLATGQNWDAAIAEVVSRDLIAGARRSLNAWTGPRWIRSGWFHAYQLLAGSLPDTELRQQVDRAAERLKLGRYRDSLERINLERDLVRDLTMGCHSLVAGYTLAAEPFNNGFSSGIENIGFDALEGLNSPLFLRTVKLKDFPWNGWLQLGLVAAPAAAFNPLAGFNDAFGRLLWSAVGDPALVPSPYGEGWMLNRLSEVEQTAGQ